jgi:hypothetical protein
MLVWNMVSSIPQNKFHIQPKECNINKNKFHIQPKECNINQSLPTENKHTSENQDKRRWLILDSFFLLIAVASEDLLQDVEALVVQGDQPSRSNI